VTSRAAETLERGVNVNRIAALRSEFVVARGDGLIGGGVAIGGRHNALERVTSRLGGALNVAS